MTGALPHAGSSPHHSPSTLTRCDSSRTTHRPLPPFAILRDTANARRAVCWLPRWWEGLRPAETTWADPVGASISALCMACQAQQQA